MHNSPPRPAADLERFIDRNRRLQAACGIPAVELDDDGWQELFTATRTELAAQGVRERQEKVTDAWTRYTDAIEVQARADLEYLTGTTDFHPLIHGDGYPLEYLTAADLSGRHLGKTFRSVTYPSADKTARARPAETYTADTIHHLKNGCVLINGSATYLRPDTEVILLNDPAASAAAA